MHLEVPRMAPSQWRKITQAEEGTAEVASRVRIARERQQQRNAGILNARLSGKALEEAMDLPEKELQFVEQAVERLRLSARAYFRILKVARTIADLAGSKGVGRNHLAEAISYRCLDRAIS